MPLEIVIHSDRIYEYGPFSGIRTVRETYPVGQSIYSSTAAELLRVDGSYLEAHMVAVGCRPNPKSFDILDEELLGVAASIRQDQLEAIDIAQAVATMAKISFQRPNPAISIQLSSFRSGTTARESTDVTVVSIGSRLNLARLDIPWARALDILGLFRPRTRIPAD